MSRIERARLREAGFTMTELMVAMAVVGLVLAGLTGFLSAGHDSYLTGVNQVEAQQNIRVAVSRMMEEIKGAGYGCPGTSPPCTVARAYNPVANGQTTTSLTIQNDWNLDGVINTGIIVCTEGGTPPACVGGTAHGEQVTYTFNGTQLTRQESTIDAAPRILVDGVQALTFTYYDANNTTPPAGGTPNIRMVEVDLVTRPATNTAATWQAGKTYVRMVDRVRIRNF